MNPEIIEALRRAVTESFPQAVAELTELVAIPSIAWPAFGQDQVRRSAEAVSALAVATGAFTEVGVHTAAVPGTDAHGQPAVLATRPARPGRRRVLLYAHHDVQPVGDEALWLSPPFVATERDGRLYGRGTADDKAGVITHLAALRAVRQVLGDDFGAGVTMFVEGEEEYGSRSFGQFLSDHREAMDADLIVVADSGNWDTRTPGITMSLRGNARFTLRVRTLQHALHSGMFGGAVPDAMLATIRLLATLWDDAGAVAVPGLASHDGPPTPEYSEERLREETGLLPAVSPIGRGDLLARIWNQPSITVTGIDFPSAATASNTLHPEVSVVVSTRVAPGQDAREAYEAVRAHLEAHAPFGAELSFDEVDCGQGFLATEGWASDLVRESFAEAYGVEPLELGEGGSIPFVAELAAEFPEAAVLVTGALDPLASPHSPNESLHLQTFANAILGEALILARLSLD